MLPKQARGTFRKHIKKPSEQVAAPQCMLLALPIPVDDLHLGLLRVPDEHVRDLEARHLGVGLADAHPERPVSHTLDRFPSSKARE